MPAPEDAQNERAGPWPRLPTEEGNPEPDCSTPALSPAAPAARLPSNLMLISRTVFQGLGFWTLGSQSLSSCMKRAARDQALLFLASSLAENPRELLPPTLLGNMTGIYKLWVAPVYFSVTDDLSTRPQPGPDSAWSLSIWESLSNPETGFSATESRQGALAQSLLRVERAEGGIWWDLVSNLALPFAGYVEVFLLLSSRPTDNIGENTRRHS